jgi:hypothetical protein
MAMRKLALGLALACLTGSARADEPLGAAVLGAPPDPPTLSSLRVEAVNFRITSFFQDGHGYQSKAGPTVLGPGSERLLVFEPQGEIILRQGSLFTHRVLLPVDIVTAASPDALDKNRPDAISQASRQNEAGSLAFSSTLHVDPHTDLTLNNGMHFEEPFRSWHVGLGASHSFAEDNAVISGNVLEIVDWFDKFDIDGNRDGRLTRTSSSANVGLTQILSRTAVAHVDYGITLQLGALGNTWNSVPLASGLRGGEILPKHRVRHALVGRVVQGLPWDGSIRGSYRFYADDWGIVAHTVEFELAQRLSRVFYVKANYRVHFQQGAYFFTTLAPDDFSLRTADSDLAPLGAQTVGLRLAADFEAPPFKMLHLDVGAERYFRTNDLSINIVTCGVGYRF